MATHRLSILGNEKPETGVALSLVSAQITSATLPSVGGALAYVTTDGGTDLGLYGCFEIPQNYVGTPKLIIKAMLDGAPAAAGTLQFGFRKRAVADNESADGTFDAEQTSVVTGRGDSIVGSNGANYADEDLATFEITLTGGDYAVADIVEYYVYQDATGDYAGNVLWRDVLFQYADA